MQQRKTMKHIEAAKITDKTLFKKNYRLKNDNILAQR